MYGDRKYFVSPEAIECLDGRFDQSVEFVHSREREDEANMEIALDLARSYSTFESLNDERISEMFMQLKESPEYDTLTQDEHLDIQRYMNRIGEEDESSQSQWTIVGDISDEGRLFPFAPAIRKIPAELVDVALLTGWGGLDVAKASDMDINDYQDYGCNSRLQLLQLLGALSSMRVEDFLESSEAIRDTSPGIVTRRTYMGGTMHFDFYMGVKERYPNGSIDPIGIKQNFAPDGCHKQQINCYHSVEENLMTNLLFWAHQAGDGQEETQLQLFREAIIGAVSNVDKGNTNNPFSAGTAEHYEDELSYFPMNLIDDFAGAHLKEDGSKTLFTANLYGALGSHGHNAAHIEEDGSLSLRSFEESKTGLTEVQRIVFSKEELAPFIELAVEHAYRGLGRTSLSRVLSLIALRFFPEECDGFSKMGYYENRKKLPQLAAELVLGATPEPEEAT